MDGEIRTAKDGHVFIIEIDRVQKRNAFTPQMLTAISEAYDVYEDDSELWCALVCAKGDHFSAGLDLMAMAPVFNQGGNPMAETSVNPWGTGGRPRTKPVVVAVQGTCLTLGIELILASDVAVAADNTAFAQIEVKRGIFPFGGATTRFHARCGWGNAMRWILTGDKFDAAEAHRMGLVQEVAPAGQERERALAIAKTIAAQAPLAVQATLQSAWESVHEGERAAHQNLNATVRRLAGTADAAEGMASFVERRDAVFTGK